MLGYYIVNSMKKFYLTLFIFLSVCTQLVGQHIQPLSGAKLNYIQVLFEGKQQAGAVRYELSVWESDTLGRFSSKGRELYMQDEVPLFIVKKLNWACSYKWLYKAVDSLGQPFYRSDTAYFSILRTDEIWLEKYYFQVNKQGDGQGYVLSDGSKSLIDRKGEVQWLMPRYISLGNKWLKGLVRDLRLTESGTFSCMFLSGEVVEFDRDGKVLWVGPNKSELSKDTSAGYHHDFRRLPNGNYMVLGLSTGKMVVPKLLPTEAYQGLGGVSLQGDSVYVTLPFGNVLEYNPAGELVWFWDSRPYFKALYEKGEKPGSTHLNAFIQDSAGSYIYLSFRDLNTILKLDKAKKEIVATLGQDILAGQHGVELGSKGEIITFDNQARKPNPSSALILSPPTRKSATIKVLYGLSCKLDEANTGKTDRSGSAELMPNGNILVGMGSMGRVAEIRPQDSAVVWDMFCSHLDSNQHKVLPLPAYRDHFVQSMYPYLFRLAQKGSMELVIYNRGELPETYEIESLTATGEQASLLRSPLVPAGGQHKVNLRKSTSTVNVRGMHSPLEFQSLLRSKE